jgi:acyl-coenzyme A thioesterase PaaI-like protein
MPRGEPEESSPPRDLSRLIPAVSVRTGDSTVSTTLGLRDSLLDDHGLLRIGVISYTVDIATGLAMGVAVLDRELWVVTTDLDVHLTTPVRTGPLRVEVEVLRAGETTAVSSFSLHDDGLGRIIGGGTATGRPFPFKFDRTHLEQRLGEPLDHSRGLEPVGGHLIRDLGLRVGEDGTVEVDIEDWLRNPWGILHGGVTACMIDVAGDVTGSAAFGGPVQPLGEMVRYLAPGRVGPVIAVPTVVSVDDGRALVDVRVVDVGADRRLLAVGTVAVGQLRS